MAKKRILDILSKTTLLILSLIVSLIIGIAIESYFFCPPSGDVSWHDSNIQFDSELGWKPIPGRSIITFGDKKVSSNSSGFRSPEIDSSKEHILVAGDSVAWGYGVGDDETVSSYLQSIIGSENRNFQVLNLGVSGYAVDQYLMHLQKSISKTNPRVIIVIFCQNNDLCETGRNYAWGKSKPLFIIKHGKLENINKHVHKYSRTSLLTSSRISNSRLFQFLIKTIAPSGRLHQIILGQKELNPDMRDSVCAALIGQMNDLATRHNAKLLFVISPSKRYFTDRDDYSLNSSYLYFSNLFDKYGYDYIDYFKRVTHDKANADKLYLPGDDCHYSPYGNKYLAKLIYEKLASTKSLK